ncbi:M3 family metallopeptidase [Sphingomonas lutea]|uniref:M3 family metallopeptidase n=1 Tax=Sphingomonas lutea TaxID=1045317 RepID=A0A7G9SKD5_9SPHN|nr:M3 family metallopeptidase [Sphingomonas lutea]QNN68310.1 M3 family metallopeptidase [Sphingomonas lutea]
MKRMMLAGSAMVALTTGLVGQAMAADAIAAAGAQAAAQAVPNNILLQEWTGPYDGVPPWDKVQPNQFAPAFQFAIDEQRREYQAIANNPEAPTFANTIEAGERAGQRLGRVLAVFGVHTDNLSTPEIQAIDKEWSPKLTAAFDEITLDPKLFARVETLYNNRASLGLDAKQTRLLERTYESMVRNGAKLNPQQKAQLSQINQQLSSLFSDFNNNLLADEGTFIRATAAEMAGVSDDVKNAAAEVAKSKGLPAGTYAIRNTRSAVEPVLTFGSNRALRQKVFNAFVNRGDNGNANDNNANIAKIVKLRADRAKLLGYPTHAHWRMQDTMAKDPQRAMDLMMRVWTPAVARVKEEVADQMPFARRDGITRIEPWDYRYYQEKVRKAKYDLSEDEIKPYLELSNLVNGMFWSAGQLYGLQFKENTGTVPVFHPDVRTFEVSRNGQITGLFYLDTYGREGKRSGAWMTTYRSRAGLLGDDIVLASNNNNFTKPAAGQPVLVSLDDASTLFHEFGHAIHYLLMDVKYPSLGGSQRDFVEYPSQVNENWLLTRPVLERFAKHYQTGQPMPQALVDKIEKAETFNQGFSTVEYLSSALVDMKLHLKPDGVINADAFERQTLGELGMPREMVMRHRLPQFGHLFSGDSYSAGYYSYLWSETMDADTWAAFEETGNPFDKATADRFRTTLLTTGNETDRAEAYRQFRGRDPDVNALLKRRGFPTGGAAPAPAAPATSGERGERGKR